MGTEKNIIVAVELGSTSIRAIAGQKQPDGTMQVLGIEQEEATNAIRKGLIDNIDKTTQAISRVVGKLNDKLKVNINRLYIGLAGQSLHTEANSVPRRFEEKTQITAQLIDQLMDINHGTMYPDARILETIPQECRIGNRSISEPIGMQTDAIEARYINIIARTSLTDNIEKCLRAASLQLAEILISPVCLADALLTASEKRSGCALINMGADTTTVSIYTNNLLRHLAVIPIGGSNVTTDIATKASDQEEAEQLKLKYGTAWHDEPEEKTNKIQLSYDRTITEGQLQVICEARYEEIIANAWAHIKPYADKLLSGIIITGGASRVRNLTKAFTEYTKFDKQVRLVKGLPGNITLDRTVHIGEPDTLHTLMSLLLNGTITCVGEAPVDKGAVQTTLEFGPEETTTQPAAKPVEPVEPAAPTPDDPPVEPRKPRKPKGPGFGAKVKGLWSRINDMLSEDDDKDE